MSYTKEQHIAALRKAVDAGDMGAAEQIAATLDAMQGTPEAPEAPKEESLYAGMLDTAKDAYDTVGGTMKAGGKGFLMGGGDIVNAGVYAAGEKLIGDERPYGEVFDEKLAVEKQEAEQFSEEHGALSFGAEIVGSIASPINKALGALKVAKGTSGLATAANTGAQGAIAGSGYVFLDTDGSIVDRLDAASSVAVPSAMFGVVGGKAMSLIGDGGIKLMSVSTDVFKKVFAKTLGTKQGNSTTAILKQSKNDAYQLVKDNNIRFGGSMINKAKNAFVAKVQASKNFSNKSKIHADTMELVEDLTVSARGKGVELIELDVAQQALWKKYKGAKVQGEESVVLDAINMIDDLIKSHPSTSEAMNVARLANRRYMKAETIDRITNKIKLDESFKGKPKVDQMKAALAKIINNPRDVKHYDAAEIARFKEFIADDGTAAQKVIKAFGNLSPTALLGKILQGGGGATAISTGGVSLAATAALGAAGYGAKKYAEGAANRRTAAFAKEMQGNARAAKPTTGNGGMLTGPVAGAYNDDNQRYLEAQRRSAR